MKIIAIISVLVCMLLMFFVRREYKIAIMFLGTMIFTLVDVPEIPLHQANDLIPLSFLISEYKHLNIYINKTKGTVVWKLAGLLILLSLITIMNSPHLRDFSSIRYFIQNELIFKYFVLLYAVWSFSSINSLKPTLYLSFCGIIVLTIFGVLNYMTQSADFVGTMLAGKDLVGIGQTNGDASQIFTFRERFRVQSMFINPFDYGYICVLVLLLHIYGISKDLISKKIFLIVAICSVFGIFTCGCRTIIFCAIIGICVFMLCAYRLSTSIKYFFFIFLLFTVVIMTIPAAQEKLTFMTSMFDDNSDLGGSSMEMRNLQYLAVLYHIQDSPLLGCGYGYFNIDLGWATGQIKDPKLQGLEGVSMAFLLERGFIGLFLYIIFYVSLIVFCFRRRFVSKQTAALGIAILGVYLTFANMTGELLSVYSTMLIIGFVVKVLNIIPSHEKVHLYREKNTALTSYEA